MSGDLLREAGLVTLKDVQAMWPRPVSIRTLQRLVAADEFVPAVRLIGSGGLLVRERDVRTWLADKLAPLDTRVKPKRRRSAR